MAATWSYVAAHLLVLALGLIVFLLWAIYMRLGAINEDLIAVSLQLTAQARPLAELVTIKEHLSAFSGRLQTRLMVLELDDASEWKKREQERPSSVDAEGNMREPDFMRDWAERAARHRSLPSANKT